MVTRVTRRSSVLQHCDTSQEKRFSSHQTLFLLIPTAIIVTCIKFMLIPAYYSTDFEVHRNWMAITSKLPISKWYTEKTSQWTLDYPPFFAYFELLLSYFAPYFDPKILQITAEPYTSRATVFYQRLTVIVSDLVYYYAVYVWLKLLTDPSQAAWHGLTLFTRQRPTTFASPRSETTKIWSSSAFIYTFLFVFNVGHLIVDHIHFQYNGLLNGILLLSMARMVSGEIYWSAVWFAVLLNFKHIYLYMAPAYFIHLLVEHCLVLDRSNLLRSRVHFKTLFTLAAIVIAVFAISFGPFIALGQAGNLLGRLFPFQRGLSHAYWAPNIWALYNGLDVVLAKTLRRPSPSIITGGLVQQSEHSVLPTITPNMSLGLVVLGVLIISAVYVWNRSYSSPASSAIRRRRSVVFIELVLISALIFFTFGYHVHEKAILLIIPPLIPLILAHQAYARIFLILSITGYFSLFPLLYKEAETPIKIILLLIHSAYSFSALDYHYQTAKSPTLRLFRLPLLSHLETLYIVGLIPLQLFYSLAPSMAPALFSRYQFVPLMSISLYCSIGVGYCFVGLLRQSCRVNTKDDAYKK